jgi:hypothetical protein
MDACEEAEIAPVISITVKRGLIVIQDNGQGIPTKTVEGVLNYSIRVSSREAYASPPAVMRHERRCLACDIAPQRIQQA